MTQTLTVKEGVNDLIIDFALAKLSGEVMEHVDWLEAKLVLKIDGDSAFTTAY